MDGWIVSLGEFKSLSLLKFEYSPFTTHTTIKEINHTKAMILNNYSSEMVSGMREPKLFSL